MDMPAINEVLVNFNVQFQYDGLWSVYLMTDYEGTENLECITWDYLTITNDPQNPKTNVVETSKDRITGE